MTIVIPVTRPADFQRLCASLTTTAPDAEVLMADGTEQGLSNDAWSAQVVVRDWPHQGFPRVSNQAVKYATRPYVLFLNDDMIVRPGSLEALVSWMDRHPKMGCGWCYFEEPGMPCSADVWVPQFPCVRWDAGQRVGWWSEEFRHYRADNDLGLKLLDAGYGIGRVSGACLIHSKRGDALRQVHSALESEDHRTYERKWGAQISRLWDTFKPWAMFSGPERCPVGHGSRLL